MPEEKKNTDPSKEIKNPEVQLEVDAMIEEYEIELRREADLTQSKSFREIERKKKTFYQRILEYELEDIRRDVKEIEEEEETIIGYNFWISLGISILIIVLALIAGDRLIEISDSISKFITHNLNWFYVLISSVFLIFLIYIASSRFGQVVLGPPNERPEFSDFSWYSMLFSAGMGVGILFWGTAEPLHHFFSPPVGESKSILAAQNSMAISVFHWGLHAWGIYTICAVGVAYYGFRKRKKYLISSSIIDFSAKRNTRKLTRSIVDLISILAVIFGVSTSLGMGIIQMSSGIELIFGINSASTAGYIIISVAVTAVFIVSSSTGLDKGIKILSNTNIIVAIALMLFVFFTGPTLFNIKVFVDSIGQYLSQITLFSFKVDPYEPQFEEWMGNWTLSYFTWWISWSPFVGIFIARISKGRTIRELIFGCLLIPTIFSIFWFSVFGGSAIHMEMVEGVSIGDKILKNADLGTFLLLDQLPLSKITSFIAVLLIFTFLVTSADSATFVISMMTSKGDLDPSMKMKIIWGIVLAALSLILLLGGGLKALQAATLIFAFPFSIVLIMIARSFYFRLSIQIKSKRK
ncbi:BCCT family transporter [Sediminitomix flava]|uniref:Glycine betaine transporter n=1 Tax=Sediminitomix flava TaxID=379075 RepID=A0A315ZU11_SEDFL|nr:BCCT family transporter [Sediminitomix flava]PWJ39169.1 glycine betaine transporter [Sediminitomix flava]